MASLGGVAAGGVRHEEVLFRVDEVEQRLFRAVEVDAADGNGDHFGAGDFNAGGGFRAVLVLACTDDEAGTEGAACDDEVVHRVILN